MTDQEAIRKDAALAEYHNVTELRTMLALIDLAGNDLTGQVTTRDILIQMGSTNKHSAVIYSLERLKKRQFIDIELKTGKYKINGFAFSPASATSSTTPAGIQTAKERDDDG